MPDNLLNNDELLRLPEVAREMKVSARVLCRLVNTGVLRAVRFSQRDIRILRSSMTEFIEAQGVSVKRGTGGYTENSASQ